MWQALYKVEFKSSYRNETHIGYISHDKPTLSTSKLKDAVSVQPLMLAVKATDETIESPIRGSELVLAMYCDTSYEFLTLCTADCFKYQMHHYFNSAYIWKGYIVPGLYSEPHKPAEYPVNIHGSDALGILKKFDWLDTDKSFYTGKKEIFQIIVDILKLTRLELGITDSSSIYETHIDSDQQTDSPLKQLYIDAEIFMTSETEVMNCYEVLEMLCLRFHLIIRQYGGYFNIIQINSQKDDYYRRFYNSDGTYQTYDLYDPIVSITSSDASRATFLGWVDEWATDTFLLGWRSFKIIQDYGLKTNMLGDNWIFGTGYINDGDPYDRYDAYSPYYQKARLTIFAEIDTQHKHIENEIGDIEKSDQALIIRFSVFAPYSGTEEFYGEEWYNWMKERIGYLTLYVKIYASDGIYFLSSAGYWTKDKAIYAWENTLKNWDTVSLKSMNIPADGRLVISWTHHHPEDKFGGIWQVFMEKDAIYIDNLNEGEEITTELNPDNLDKEEYDLLIGDIPDIENNSLMYKGGIYYKSGSNYIPTTAWSYRTPGTFGRTGTLNEILSDQVCQNHIHPMIRREGKLMGLIKPTNIILEDECKFMIITCNSDFADDTHDVNILQISGSLDENLYLEYKSGKRIALKGGGLIKLKGKKQ